MKIVVLVYPAPDLGAQLCGVLLDDIPEGVVRVERIAVHGVVGAEVWLRGAGDASVELEFEAASHHGQLPGPDDGAVVGGVCEVLHQDRLGGERWVGHDEADGCAQAGGERTQDVEGGLVQEGGELGLVGGVEEEVSETVVRVHDVDGLELRVAVQGKRVELYVWRGCRVVRLAGSVVEG